MARKIYMLDERPEAEARAKWFRDGPVPKSDPVLTKVEIHKEGKERGLFRARLVYAYKGHFHSTDVVVRRGPHLQDQMARALEADYQSRYGQVSDG